MVEPGDVGQVLLDAARLVREGQLVVFGSSALAFWMEHAPATRDVDLWVDPAERGDAVEALMGELSWYHEKHGCYVEVWRPETFAAPVDWRDRSKQLTDESVPGVVLVVPHPHDVLLAKVERWEPADKHHASLILSAFPMSLEVLRARVSSSPYRLGAITEPLRVAAFEAHLSDLRALLDR